MSDRYSLEAWVSPGVMVDLVGYQNFFLFTAVIGLPVLLLVGLAWRFVPVNGELRER